MKGLLKSASGGSKARAASVKTLWEEKGGGTKLWFDGRPDAAVTYLTSSAEIARFFK